MPSVELLSPAKNKECGIAAINHGADAVYIGAPMFSARASAGNSVEDIESLVQYAHRYRAKVLVALNTVLTDEQLPEAEKIIRRIYEAGADALIVQDMGILQFNLPPIALHASTQTDNRNLEKVRFLEQTGFSRVVLARELSLSEISDIAANTHVELEAFVHGSLCVSYSGQCYISQAICGRSANRGECAQFCRLPYDLLDASGKVLVENKHLLSLKDLNLSAYLEDMIDVGVSSFKIEGRLKDADYVKNITAFYRQKLDGILENKTNYRKSSFGKTTFFFEPDPAKSFNRGFTDYFLNERGRDIIQPNTPKSLGERIGEVKNTARNYFELSENIKINNGDGICFISRQGDLEGFRVNRAENNRIYPAEMPALYPGAIIYRNYDFEFEKTLKQKTSERKIALDILFSETESGFSIHLTDEEGIASNFQVKHEKQLAQKPDGVVENIKNQLSKLGNTIYEARFVDVQLKELCFFPNSVLNEWRRQAIEQLDIIREKAHCRPERKKSENAIFPQKTLTYLGNVTNKLSREFYQNHGVSDIDSGFEIKPQDDVALMFCKHCIKYTLGWCPKQKKSSEISEALFLRNKERLYELIFDCKRCEMRIRRFA